MTQHTFAFVLRKQYFGQGAIVCEDTDDISGPSNFLLVQHIGYRCAYSKAKCNPQGFEETMLIVCPVPIKHSI